MILVFCTYKSIPSGFSPMILLPLRYCLSEISSLFLWRRAGDDAIPSKIPRNKYIRIMIRIALCFVFVASMLFALVLLLLFFGVSGSKAKKNKSAPSGLLSFLEPLVLFVRDDIVKPNIGKNYQKYLKFIFISIFCIYIYYNTCSLLI